MSATCNQRGCTEPGAYRFTWPGRDEAAICETHVHKLCAVADAMGMYLQVQPIEPKAAAARLAQSSSEGSEKT